MACGQDTITPPGVCKKMKRATVYGIATTTFFYACIGIIGYAAFGNSAPGNLLSGCVQGTSGTLPMILSSAALCKLSGPLHDTAFY